MRILLSQSANEETSLFLHECASHFFKIRQWTVKKAWQSYYSNGSLERLVTCMSAEIGKTPARLTTDSFMGNVHLIILASSQQKVGKQVRLIVHGGEQIKQANLSMNHMYTCSM